MTVEAFASVFRSAPFALAADDPLIAAMWRNATTVLLAPGEALCREGDPADAFWLLTEGALQVSVRDDTGRTVVVQRAEPVQLIGETALLRGESGRRNATVVAAESSRLWRVEPKALDGVVQRDHPLWGALHRLDSERTLKRLAAIVQQVGAGALSLLDPTERSLARGDLLFREGETARHVYLLASGAVAVYRTQDVQIVQIRTIEHGQCFGESDVLEQKSRSETVVAHTAAVLLEIDGTRFLDAVAQSPELRDWVTALSRLYAMPRRGFVTQLSGEVDGAPAITTLYRLAGGAWMASHVVGQDCYVLRRIEPAADIAATRVYRSDDVERTVSVDAAGRILSLRSRGWWSELEALQAAALDGVEIDAEHLDAFSRSGRLSIEAIARPDYIVCSCLQISLSVIERAVADGCDTYEALSARTGCGTVCGGCAPRVRGLLGTEGWAALEIVDEQRITTDVLRVRFRPRRGTSDGEQRPSPHHAGQHVLIQGNIGGVWVRRAYTLSSGARNGDHQEVLVERVPGGAFSTWLFGTSPLQRRLQVSPPQGGFAWAPSERPTVCWVAGIGVTPALAIARTADEIDHGAPVHVDLSVRQRASAAGLDELALVAARRRSLSIRSRITSEEGRLTATDVATTVARFPEAQHVVCGPPAYLDDLAEALATADVPSADILVERFHAAAAVVAGVDGASTAGRPSLRSGSVPPAERRERAAAVVRTLVSEGALLGRSPLHAAEGEGETLRLSPESEPPGVQDDVGYVAATYAEVQNIPALEAAVAALILQPASAASTWRAVLQSVELALDVGARLADDIVRRLEADEVESAADRMDWLTGIHALVVALAGAGSRATGRLARAAGHPLSVQASPARARLMTATRRIDLAMRRLFEQSDAAHGDRLGAMLASGHLCEPESRLDHAACIAVEHWRVWERALSAVPVGIPGTDYCTFVDAVGIARVVDRPAYDTSTLINPFRGLHLIPERLAREAIDHLDHASTLLEEGTRTPDDWEAAWHGVRTAVQLMRPMRMALPAMIEGLSLSEYRRFRKNFGRTSASESDALSEALFHRAPERLGDAIAGALGLAEGDEVTAAIDRLPAAERMAAQALLDAFDELHGEVTAWLDTHMLLPVLHLGKSRSLAGRIDAVTSNRLKRSETLNRGWFGRLAAPPADEVEPSSELDEAAGYLTWRALRVGEVQGADAAHLAEDQPAGRVLDRIRRHCDPLERGATE